MILESHLAVGLLVTNRLKESRIKQQIGEELQTLVAQFSLSEDHTGNLI
jgi:hypothetical protein